MEQVPRITPRRKARIEIEAEEVAYNSEAGSEVGSENVVIGALWPLE